METAPGSEPAGAASAPGGGVDWTALVDVLPDALLVLDADGVVVFANRAARDVLGRDPAALVGTRWDALVPAGFPTPYPGGLAGVRPEQAPAGDRPMRARLLRADGTEAQVDVVLSPWQQPDGRLLLVASLRGAQEQAELERQHLLTGQLLEILAEERAPAEIVGRLLAGLGKSLGWAVAAMWRATGDTVSCEYVWPDPSGPANRFAAGTLHRQLPVGEGWPGRVVESGAPAWITDLASDRDFRRAPDAAAEGLASAFAFPIRTTRQILGVIELFSAQRRLPDQSLLDTTATIGSQLGEFLERAEAEAERDELVRQLRSAQRTQQFLLDASRILAEAVGYQPAVEQLAALAVRLLGDICMVDVVEDGRLVRMAARHADPRRQELVDELRRYPPDPVGPNPIVQVSASGRSRWSAFTGPDFHAAISRDARHLRVIQELGVISYLSVPLVARTRTLGTLTLLSCSPERPLSGADLTLAEELAGQVAAVVDNARLLEREHQMAHLLQRSLLPQHIPSVPGLAVAVRYLPAGEGAEVGGDWYDVIPLADGLTGLVVGDVAGHDVAAASIMGQLRAGLRAFVAAGLGPAAALTQLHAFLRGLEQDRIATAVYGRYDPATCRLVLASAGHLPPLLLRARGPVEPVDLPPGPPLGAGAGSRDVTVTLDPGDTVLLYTDGLIERRHSELQDGMELLRAAVAGADHADPDTLAEAVLSQMPPDRDDDVAVLAATAVPRS